MDEFLVKVAEQEAKAAQIDTLRSNYKKEPKRRLKKVDRLREWMGKLEELWRNFNTQHIELQQGREILADTNYNKNKVYENTKLLYEDMKSNIRFLLGSANLQAFNDIFGNEAETTADGESSNAANEQENRPTQNTGEFEDVLEVKPKAMLEKATNQISMKQTRASEQ